MREKLLITIYGNDIHPRFDLTSEVLLAHVDRSTRRQNERIVVLPQSNAEELCNLIVKENIHTLICGGIEDEYYQYFKWKKINIIDSIIGPYRNVLRRFIGGSITPGEIVRE